MQKVEISICLVAYKSDDLLLHCLDLLYQYKPTVTYEIIIIDNNEDTTLQSKLGSYKHITYIKSPKNGGYGAGNNLAIANAAGEYLLIMNPDVQIEKGTIDTLYRFLKRHPQAAAVGPAFQKNNNRLYPLGGGELSPLRAVFALSFINKFLPQNKFSQAYYLHESDRTKDLRVWSVPGAAALFRKKALREVGGYDEQLFLYYEEADLGRRLKKKGWELWITNKAVIKHDDGKSTRFIESNKLKAIFIQSRVYYFKKHFGFLSALIVEAFTRFGKYEAAMCGIFIVAAILRLYRVSENMVFHGELGDNYLAMKNIILTGKIPLLGPPTSHPWLSFGPLYYWLFSPVLVFLQYSPVRMAVLFGCIHAAIVVVNYAVISGIHNRKIALISSFLIALSPAYIGFAHESRFFGLTLLLFYPFYYYLNQKRYVLTGFFFAVLLNFHLTPIIYLPALLLFLLYVERNSITKIIRALLQGFFVGFLPFFIYNAQHHFEMLKNALLWIPYRIAGFVGLVPKNTVNSTVVSTTVGSGFQFIKSTFLPLQTNSIISILILIFIGIACIKGLMNIKRGDRSQLILLGLLLIIGYGAIFIHGSPPTHYFLPLYPLLILVTSIGLSRIQKSYLVISVIFIVLSVINLNYYFSDNWFFHQQTHVADDIPVPYTLQIEVARSITQDAAGNRFSLKRVGAFDQFEQNYSQNYRYLLWKDGNEPLFGSSLIYTIYETETAPINEKTIFSKGGITVTKSYEIDTIIT